LLTCLSNPYAFRQFVHKEDKEQDDDVEEQDDDIIHDGTNADTDRVVETGKEANDAEDKEQDDGFDTQKKIPNMQDKETALKKAPSTRGK
jgi:hypothetical protein